jgi:CheY-like chemotaxis protein
MTRHSIRESGVGKTHVEDKTLPFKDAQILLVEDDPTNQMVAELMLKKYGCHVTPAWNGMEAVQMMKQQHFDLVFMDCQMPEMDGFEATRVIRSLEEAGGMKRTSIIACTAHAMKGDDGKCYAAGMDDYLTKPIKVKELESALSKWLK